jgi:hypothetical protein
LVLEIYRRRTRSALTVVRDGTDDFRNKAGGSGRRGLENKISAIRVQVPVGSDEARRQTIGGKRSEKAET